MFSQQDSPPISHCDIGGEGVGEGIYDRKDQYIVLHRWTTGHSPKLENAKISGNPGSILIFGTALLESLVFKINKYYWRRKSCNKSDRAVLHEEVRFSIFDHMTETCCRLRPLEGSGDK